MTIKVQLPETGFLRLAQIICNPKSETPPLIPVCSSTWWNGVNSGHFPKPVKLGPRTTAWRVQDIRALIEKLNQGESLCLDRLTLAALNRISDSLREKGAGHLADAITTNNPKELTALAREIELGGYYEEAEAIAALASDFQ